jgi:eukaryotic-like serine/threonine-protein kinase
MDMNEGDATATAGDQGTGRTIGGRYLLTSRLGSGGMGVVWRARDQLLDRDIAIKELHPTAAGTTESQNQMERATREARAIARISHPHVVEIYDLVNHQSRLWIVMELIEGPSLDEFMATSGPMPPQRVAALGLQLLGAIEAVHAAGALHRDIKPANVLLRPDGNAVLTDFGLVALTGEEPLTSTGVLLGSAEYMSPERLNGEEAGPPSDLWSLGVTLCAAAAGKTPFWRAELAARLTAVASEQPTIPDRVGPLRPVIEALLHKDPHRRPSGAEAAAGLRKVADMAADTSPWLSGPMYDRPPAYTKTLAEPRPHLPAPGRRGGRKRVRWAVTAAGMLLAAGGTVTGLLLTGTPPFATGPTKISTAVTVDAAKNWQEVNVPVLRGDKLSLRYTKGTWTVDYRQRPLTGPEGINSREDADLTGFAGGCKVNDKAPFGALLGRFSWEPPGTSHILQQHEWAYTAASNGTLSLRINDEAGCLSDNRGNVDLIVRITRRKS